MRESISNPIVNKIYTDFSENYGISKLQSDYINEVVSSISNGSVILDAGCGKEGIFSKYRSKNIKFPTKLIGTDLYKGDNKLIDEQYVASLTNLPFEDSFFDVVVCEWVMEHVEFPTQALKEIHRVLKPNGKFIFFTPNKNNLLVLLSNIIGNRAKDFLLKLFLGFRDDDLFPLFLRCNTINDVRTHAASANFKISSIKTFSNPYYFSFNEFALLIATLFNKILINFKVLDPLKVYLLATLQK